MRSRLRLWTLPLLLSLVTLGCGGNTPGAPDAGGGGNVLSVGGSYPTSVTLLPGGTYSVSWVAGKSGSPNVIPG